MTTRSPRTILAFSAATALTVAALAPTAVLAKGPYGDGSGSCDGDCTSDTPQLQVQARNGSGGDQANRTQANAGGGGQVQARSNADNTAQTRNGNAGRNANTKANGNGQNAKSGAGNGPNEDGQRGPGTCDDCTAEMGTLTDEQAAGLVFMANEEKMAHDVYAAFADQYGVRIFSNIAESEAMHQEAVDVVLERYGLENPVADLPAGEFSDPMIASLYDTLIEQGSASLEEAIGVGVIIEETDIADLESRMADLVTSAPELESSTEGLKSSAPDVHEMYSHLQAASQNHLSAFEGWL